MKRLISFVLCMVLLSSCVTIHAAASQLVPTVALSSSQGSAGEEVSVTATIANNPGIVSMYLQLDYDRTRLQLVSVTDHGLLAGKMFSQAIDSYPYMMSWDDSAALEANTANGTLVTLTFKILDDAPLGNAEIRLSNYAGILDFDLNLVAFDFVAGRISVVEDAASSENMPTVAVGSSEGSAGQEVSVTATVVNNPGIVSMYLQLDYDRTRLQLVSVTDHGLLAGKMFSQTIDSYPYMMSWDDSAALEANTANGTLVTLTFKILDDAPIGDAEIRLSNSGGILDFDLNPVAFDFVAGKISVVEDAASSEIVSADMVLGDDITVNYYAKLDSAHVGAQMRFTMNGTQTIVSGVETEEDGVYVYAFQEVAPQCMGDNIKAELMLGDAVLAVKAEYSVRTYCLNMLAKSASELGLSAQKYAALKTLIADMLEYGAQAQMYRNYKTNNLVNQGITGQSEFVELDSDECDEIIEQSGNFTLTGVHFVSANMYFDYYNTIYVKFNAPNMTDSNFRIRLKDGEENILGTYKLSDCELVSEEDSTYVFTLPALYATEFEDFYIIELCKYTSRATTMQWSLNYGVSSYICAKQNNVDEFGDLTPMARLARATYNYGLSAIAYQQIAR